MARLCFAASAVSLGSGVHKLATFLLCIVLSVRV